MEPLSKAEAVVVVKAHFLFRQVEEEAVARDYWEEEGNYSVEAGVFLVAVAEGHSQIYLEHQFHSLKDS